MIREQKKSLKKQVKLTAFFLINLKKKITIILVMLPLKMVVVDKVDLEVLEVSVVQIFRTYLKIFLVTSVVEEEVLGEEVQIIEALI